jgi:hypothetical protein
VKQRLDGGRIDRLDHMVIEPGRTRSSDILFLAPNPER